jgi:type VII secretion protein EccE
MPRSVLTQLVLLQIAAAGVVVGLAFEGPWLAAGVVVAVVALALLVPVRRRSLYLVVRSWWAMRSRRRRTRGEGIASLVGGTYQVVTVPRGSGGVSVGAIRDGTTWTVPLSLPLLDVFNDDPPIPVEGLARLLTIEDVPLSSVRVVTLLSPSAPGAAAPPGASAPLSRLATRFLVLTLDTAYAADVIAARGGSAAIEQILRRCVLRAEEVLNGAGVALRRLQAGSVELHSASSLGPVQAPDGTYPPALERPDHVLMAGSTSMTFALTGKDAMTQVEQLAGSLAVPIVATSVAVQPGPAPQRTPTLRLLVRLSGPAQVVREGASRLEAAARQRGLGVHRLLGDQVPELRATTLLGVPAETMSA